MTATNHSDPLRAQEDRIVSAAIEILEKRFHQPLRRDMDGDEAKRYFRLRIGPYRHEVFAVMFIDPHSQMIACEEMFRGTIDHAHLHPREVVKRALELNAAGVVIAHNHPTGPVVPSEPDVVMTNGMAEALRTVDVKLLDSLVVSPTDAFSMGEMGLLP